MTRPTLIIVEPDGFSQKALEVLGRIFNIKLGPMTRTELLREVPYATGLVIRLAHRIDSQILASATQLRFIASPTTGLNHVDEAEAARRGIEVISLKGERAFLDGIHATAEHTWALLLALVRQVPAAVQSVNGGNWVRDDFRGTELHGRTLGIIGFGRLGSKVAAFGQAFGMTVLATDPIALIPDSVKRVNLGTLAARADIVSIHVSYSKETHGLIGESFFAALKKGALLLNTSRGEVIDEQMLLLALQEGRIGGAALDVLCGENVEGGSAIGSEALRNYARTNDNLIITPHIGGATVESMGKTEEFIAGKIVDFVQRNWHR